MGVKNFGPKDFNYTSGGEGTHFENQEQLINEIRHKFNALLAELNETEKIIAKVSLLKMLLTHF